MTSPRHRILGAAASALLAIGLLAGCVPDQGSSPGGTPSPGGVSGTPSPIETEKVTTPSPTPTPTITAAAVPTDCRAILSPAVLAELGDTPLNDPAFGASGVQADGSLLCVWADPRADTTGLVTEIKKMSRGPALDMLNDLAATQGFTCYTPSGGTRCEKTWDNATYPVTDGRTLFWRGDLLIDTRYSNLAPTGYTDSIVTHLFG